MNNASKLKRPEQADYHHGRHPAGWAGSLTCMVGFIVAAVGMIAPGFSNSGTMEPNMVVVGLGAALIAIGAIATLLLKSMGYGNPPRDL